MPPLQPCYLADVLCEAPALLALLSSQDKAALFSCGKQLQHAIHSSVKVIMVKKVRDAAAVMRGSWPRPSLIKVEPAMHFISSHDLRLPQNIRVQLIASIDAVLRNAEIGVAFVVAPSAEADQHTQALLQPAGIYRPVGELTGLMLLCTTRMRKL